jgi:hypothetical protein
MNVPGGDDAPPVPPSMDLQTAGQKLQDAITADPKHYSVEFENDIVLVLRVRLGAGDRTPAHLHSAYYAIELTDSSLKEATGTNDR